MPARAHRLLVPTSFLLLAAVAGCLFDADPPNDPPVIDAVTADPDRVAPDSTLVAVATARDPEGATLDYRWTATAGWFESGSTEAEAVWRAPSTTGPCTLTVTVDDDRDEVSGAVVVTVMDHPDQPMLIIEMPDRSFGLAETRLPVRLQNVGGADADWTAAAAVAWATPSPAAGALAPGAVDTLWLEADRGAVSPGLHTSQLTVSWQNDSLPLPFALLQPWTYRVIADHPHDPQAFTQGLVWHEGSLYESTGRHGHSQLREVELETGQVLRSQDLGNSYFGEGLTIWQDRLLQLTWLSETAFVWALDDFALLDQLTYPTHGWGLTHDGTRLIMTDGSATLYFRDPDTFVEIGRVTVDAWGEPLSMLNELEWIDGAVWANVWQTDLVVRIDPESGSVTDVIDLAGLLSPGEIGAANVLNGIAHDPATGRVWVTGKFWPRLFEIELVDPSTIDD